MTIIEILGYIGYIAGAVVILTSKAKTANLNDLKDRVDILERELQYSKEENTKYKTFADKRHMENQKAISKLEGQVETYKQIPLQSIDASLLNLVDSSKQILDSLVKQED